MTVSLTRDNRVNYDEHDRWLDDRDGGDRWQRYVNCRNEDRELFFPEDQDGNEPTFPPPDAKAICDRCEVRSRCLTKYVNEEFGIYGGMTGYQRGLLNKRIHRKRCPGCASTDVITERNHEICLGCGVSWEAI